MKTGKKTKTQAKSIVILTCEDASHLGGPMGTEYTTTMWTKPFVSTVAAKQFAEADARKQKFIGNEDKADWQRHSSGEQSWDARCVIFSIKRQKVQG